MKKKLVWLPYDMDTAIGINNDGQLVFDYQLEDIDHQQGGENVFNGQDSVIWKNVRATFFDELRTMYQNLRSSGALSYEKVEQMFEAHQAKWSEAIFNEDAHFKYIVPFVENNANYLYMLLGSKAEQRKWWLYNRFRYIDSKYIAGDARSDSVFLRPYAAADITLTPYADIYATIAWDATITQERATRNRAITLHCPYSVMNGNIVTVYSSSQLASIGDLSALKVGQIDISNATRLQSLKVGSDDPEYSNTNLYSMTFGSNVLLKVVDVRNCSGLGDTSIQGHTQTTVDLSGCEIIEEVYFNGTKIQGVTLPNGGVLKKLHLPATITNLTILNQKAITEFSVPSYANISTLRLENVSSVIDEKAILRQIAAGSRVRLIGIYWECEDAEEIDGLLDILDTMRGLDEQGGNVDKAQVSGTIHTSTLTGAQIAEFNARYPYITIDPDHVTSYLRYYNYNSATGAYDTLMDTVTCIDGVPERAYGGATPTRTATAANVFTFNGWSRSQNATTPDEDAETNVVADRDIYASFAVTGQTYTVTFVRGSADGGGTLQTINNVAYGTVITAASAYTGATPTTTQGDATDYPFDGWEPASATVQGDTVFTAKFGSPVEVAEITDSWDTIIANIDNGTYSTKYKIGNYKPLDLGTEGTINMQIVAMDDDELASGGYAPLTFLGMSALTTKSQHYRVESNAGGWKNSLVRIRLQNVILPLVPTNVKARINPVKKYSRSGRDDASSDIVNHRYITTDALWIPSKFELGVDDFYEKQEPAVTYKSIFKDDSSRAIDEECWTRTGNDSRNTGFYKQMGDGRVLVDDYSNNNYGIRLGFCLGLEPETITDSWETILANENPSASYSIGDTKEIDLGNEGKHLMEIVAFNEDDKADGSGKAKITWLSKTCLRTIQDMKSVISTQKYYDYETSNGRNFLVNTVFQMIDKTISNGIVDVTKRTCVTNASNEDIKNYVSTEKIWIPSYHELFTQWTSYETEGASGYAPKSNSIITLNNAGWWLRSYAGKSSGIYNVCYVYSGNASNSYAGRSSKKFIRFGFCTD